MNRPRYRWLATALAITGMIVAAGLSGAAQHATPAHGGAGAHPAHIHVGTCDNLDPNPTFPLTDVAPAAAASDEAAAEAAAIPVERSVTTVDATLEELRTGGYAINVHQSAEDIGTYIACGSLSGAVDDGGPLVVGLSELNDSGYSGVAELEAQGDQTDVTVYLVQGHTGEAATESSASAADEADAAAEAVMVNIQDFTYIPDPVEIAVGATVTWTNSDAAPHTATAQDRDVLQSGTLNESESFSQTFAAAGTFDYFCEFHPNMKGTIIVQ